MAEQITGLIISNQRYHCLVEIQDENSELNGETLRCSIRGKKRGMVCGDKVKISLVNNEEGVIEKQLARNNELARPNMRGRKEVLASNIDQLIIVVAPKPALDPELIDRYLATAEMMQTKAILVLNKTDLLNEKTESAWESFSKLPYTQFRTYAKPNKNEDTDSNLGKAVEHDDLNKLKQTMAGKTSVMVGLSGVGKSSILNAIAPDYAAETQEISAAHEEGKHTTTVATSYLIDIDGQTGRLIDSPGVRDFAPPPIPADEVYKGFIEIHETGEHCKFRDCQHLREPHCAVKQAVEDGEIDARRYKSYRHLRDLMDKLYRAY